MAHGKETPRQKMIGMMYLVLTALLALNVAAEVLNAFVLIDNSLRKTTANTVSKNDKIYSDFESALKENPTHAKTIEYKKKADEVKTKSDELVAYLDELKVKIVQTVEGPEGDPTNIVKKDDINVPGQIMITEKEGDKNRGTILKERIEGHKNFLKSLISDTAKYGGLVKGLNEMLATDDIVGQDKLKVPWVDANFNHIPLAGVVALMSKMQADIRNAESDMIGYLFEQITAGYFKFNKIEAIVNSKSNYVLVGQPYEAEVFIAASDSTIDPVIKLTGSTTPLPVKEGKGIYTGSTGSPGPKTWGGIIELKKPATGEILTFPFKGEYTVGQAALVVSPTKMNVFYIGVDNPVDVSVPGVPPSKVRPFATGGAAITPAAGGGYTVRVTKSGNVSIGATAELDGQTRNMGTKEFRVRRIPTPNPQIGGKNGGRVDKSWLTAQQGVKANLDDFVFDLNFPVISFNVSTLVRGFTEDAPARGTAVFTAQQKALINQVQSGRKVWIENVIVKMPDGREQNIGTITFTVN